MTDFGRVFFDDFETGTSALWSFEYEKADIVEIAVDGGRPHSGAYMAQGNWDGVTGTDYHDPRKGLYLDAWPYTSEFLLRFWLRYDADVDRVGGNKVVRIAGDYPHHSFYMAAAMEHPGGPLFAYWEGIENIPGPILYDGPLVGEGWHQFELYTKHHTSGQTDGILRLWVDKALVLEGVNVKSYAEGYQWGEFVFISNWSNNPGWEHDAENHVYLDDVEIFSDAGTGGTGSMADGSALAGAGEGSGSGSGKPDKDKPDHPDHPDHPDPEKDKDKPS